MIVCLLQWQDGQRQSGYGGPSQEDQLNQAGGYGGAAGEGDWVPAGTFTSTTTSLQRTVTTKDGQTVIETEVRICIILYLK